MTDESKALGADFRRKEVLEKWEGLLAKSEKEYLIARFFCTCSSGAYMRVLASRIGQELGVPALAYSITRTKIGRYLKLWRGRGVWLKQF